LLFTGVLYDIFYQKALIELHYFNSQNLMCEVWQTIFDL